MLTVGLTSATYGATAAVGAGDRLLGVCAQERVTRVRGGNSGAGWPDAAIDLLLQRLARTRDDVSRYVTIEGGPYAPPGRTNRTVAVETIDHHFAHACTAYLTSPFDGAAIVVCDHDAPGVSVWIGEGAEIRRVDWPWTGLGFAEAYSRIAVAVGVESPGAEPRLEALARLHAPAVPDWARPLLGRANDHVTVDSALSAAVEQARGSHEPTGAPASAAAAAALQARLGELLIGFLAEVGAATGLRRLCAGGSLFYHSSMATWAKCADHFDDVFVPIDPGNAGLAVGATLHALGATPAVAAPFLGPSYSAEEIKSVLDNCKLQYAWEPEERAVQIAVKALMQGRLVGWFDGAMEWGPRALGARCIVANPFAPYVLENLNRFLKRREPWRGYGLSGLEAAVPAHFDGPARAPFMECDYRPRDRSRFRSVLPSEDAVLRVHTVDDASPPRFRRLLEAFGDASGLPFLVNTSFNGFHEPIVCSPRDAVRVFYGSGIDLLVMQQFVLQK